MGTHAFELMCADLLSRVLGDIRVTVAKSGQQFGSDASTSRTSGRVLRVECKRYQKGTVLSPRPLAGEILQAYLEDPQLEAWVLMTTKSVSANELRLAEAAASALGFPIIVLDWTPLPVGAGLNRLAALCATWPEVVGKYAGEKAAAAARVLAPAVLCAVDALRSELQAWQLGFEALKDLTHDLATRIWLDSSTSWQVLHQNAAGGHPGVHLVERRGPLDQLQAWWKSPAEPRTQAVLLGQEGVGKTWVALDWVQRQLASLPLVLLVPASTFTERQSLSESGLRDLIAEQLRSCVVSELPLAYWRQRVDRLLTRPSSNGPVLLLVIDGLNQQPGIAWQELVQSLQGPGLGGKVRLLCSSRPRYFRQALHSLTRCDVAATEIPVEPYSLGELEDLLHAQGMNLSHMPKALQDLARTPRLFPLVLRLKDREALKAEATVMRLLFEYGHDTLQLRTSSSLTSDDWVQWLVDRAREYRERLMTKSAATARMRAQDIELTVARPSLRPDDVRRRLDELLDGSLFKAEDTVTGIKYTLKEAPAILGLGLVLLESMEGSTATVADFEARAATWLEPIGATDQKAEVIGAALSVLAATDTPHGASMADALLSLWMDAQNPARNFEQDAMAFGEAFPAAMLSVIEREVPGVGNAALHCATQSLRRLPLTRHADWQLIRERMLQWVGIVQLQPQRLLEDPNHFASQQQAALQALIGTVSSGARRILGEDFSLTDPQAVDPSRAIAGMLEGHRLEFFLPVIRRAAIREAINVSFHSPCWQGLQWLVSMGAQEPAAARQALLVLAQEIRSTPVEPGIAPEVGVIASALLALLTDLESEQHRTAELASARSSATDYQRDYLDRPARSHWRLERRHVEAVLHDDAISPSERLTRIDAFVDCPDIDLPNDIVSDLAEALTLFDPDGIDVQRQRTAAEYRLERLERLGARFTPAELADLGRRRLTMMLARTGEAAHWSARAASSLLLVCPPDLATRFADLRCALPPSSDGTATSACLLLEILHLPLAEQLARLLEADDFQPWRLLMGAIRPATAHELLDFLDQHASKADRAARVALAVLGTQQIHDADRLAARLTAYLGCADSALRDLAFEVLCIRAPQVAGSVLRDAHWAADVVRQPVSAHHGSMALAASTGDIPFPELMVRIAPWRWLDAAVLRGSNPEELRLASELLVEMAVRPASELPHLEGELIVRTLGDGSLPTVMLREEMPAGSDLVECLKRASRPRLEVDQALEALASQARQAIEAIWAQGHGLYLQDLDVRGLEAAYLASPQTWDVLLAGADADSPAFQQRCMRASVLYTRLADVLFRYAPTKALPLWRTLRRVVHMRLMGEAHISELVHVAMKAQGSPESQLAREELLLPAWCNTDQDLLEVVVAAKIHGQAAWLTSVIDRDRLSGEPWLAHRAQVLNAFMDCPTVNEMDWPEGPLLGSWDRLRVRMSVWRNRAGVARHWWRQFLAAEDGDSAYAAWTMFRANADRRCLVWVGEWLATRPQLSSGIDRLRFLHLMVMSHDLEREIKRKEDESPKLDGHLFGMRRPIEWLMLDGVLHS
ncbi:NACHT domain-containing protein [Ideonella sp. 4Y16]|uniref:NACHT domain-containing protein n=1 Tax=Ideonella aquatica TaxID=2824119 RepID=A0A941BRH5_9BURK|nr:MULTISPECIES: NACHT domain-containing protein [Ideonella]MBQ0946171.1 NACHT domain-containing protein [Ideonella alba]MBQ0960405.1 NACHT domain-containing protein [Ideonella aquatica]